MKNRITNFIKKTNLKRSYLLMILIIGLITTMTIGTYAVFTSSKISSNNVISLTTPEVVNIDLTNINEYKQITVKTKQYKVIKFNISNSKSSSLYYGIWYEMISPTTKSSKHIIAKLKDTSGTTTGDLSSGSSTTVYVLVQNRESTDLTINLGVGSNENNSLGLPITRKLITDTSAISKGDFSYTTTGIDLTSGKNYDLLSYTCDKGATVTYNDGTKKITYSKPDNCSLVFGESASPTSVSFSADNWATIKANITAGTTSNYNVGDTKCIALTGFTTTNSNGCSNGEFKVRIANKSTPSDCSGSDYSETACGFVIEFVDIITIQVMTIAVTNNGSWPATPMRTYVNSDIYNALPSDLQTVIATTKVVTGSGSLNPQESSLFTSNDKIYLLSPKEVWNYTGANDTGKDKTRQLDYYSGAGVTTSSYSGAIKQYNSSIYKWWLRTPCSFNSSFSVNSSGDELDNNTLNSAGNGVSPAFRIVP